DRMKPSACLINAARGRVVDEPALVDALAPRQLGGAALDVTVAEALPEASPLWAMENVLITPHTAGETSRYEDNVLAIMQENLARLWRGESALLNHVGSKIPIAIDPRLPCDGCARRAASSFPTTKRQVCSTSSTANTGCAYRY